MDPRIERTRRTVIATAEDLLREGGPDAVTHSALAARSGVGRATLYRHWPDRDTLLQDLITTKAAATRIDLSGDVRTDLVATLTAMQRNLTGAERRIRLLTMLERATRDPKLQGLLKTMEKVMPIRRAIDLAITNEQLPADLDLTVASSLLLGPLLHRDFMGQRPITPDFIAAVVDSFLASYPEPQP